MMNRTEESKFCLLTGVKIENNETLLDKSGEQISETVDVQANEQ